MPRGSQQSPAYSSIDGYLRQKKRLPWLLCHAREIGVREFKVPICHVTSCAMLLVRVDMLLMIQPYRMTQPLALHESGTQPLAPRECSEAVPGTTLAIDLVRVLVHRPILRILMKAQASNNKAEYHCIALRSLCSGAVALGFVNVLGALLRCFAETFFPQF